MSYLSIMPRLNSLSSQVNESKILAAKALIKQIQMNGVYDNIHDVEFQVFSQFGDDGIIQYLIHNVKVENQVFIEFGVGNYVESNTRLLLINNNWKGLVIDGFQDYIDYIQNDFIYWKYNLTAICAFIDKNNINQLISQYLEEHQLSKEIGILSIDIDGNDYWIWKCITVVDPVIVIVEYNSHLGSDHSLTVPYEHSFNKTEAHYSNQYWGASLKAFFTLAQRKGYQFIGCNSAGNNAYFVREDRLGNLKSLTVEEGYVESKFRDSRDQEGKLSFLNGKRRLEVIQKMPVYDIENDRLLPLKEILGTEANQSLSSESLNKK